MGKTPSSNADGLKKGAWSTDEDQKLTAYIQKHGGGGWHTLPQKAGLKRCGKSCRLRWANYLKPGIKRGGFSSEEDQQIIQLHATLGNKWSAIARRLPKRTDNEIKNYWHTHLKRRLKDMGIDPVTHKPVGPSLIPSTSDNMGNGDKSETAHYASSISTKASAHLLNKLATELASVPCLDVMINDDSNDPLRDGDINDNNCDREDAIEVDTGDTSDVESPILFSGSPEQPQSMPRPVSKSTRLLNELASGLKTSPHRIDLLRSILSESIDGISAARSATTTCLSDSATAASETSRSVWNVNGLLDHLFADSPVPLDPFDLDSLLDGSTVIGCGDDGVSSASMVDAYDIESSNPPPPNHTRDDEPTISACESSDLLNFMVPTSSTDVNEALATDEQDVGLSCSDAFEIQSTTVWDDHFAEGFMDSVAGDSSCELAISASDNGVVTEKDWSSNSRDVNGSYAVSSVSVLINTDRK